MTSASSLLTLMLHSLRIVGLGVPPAEVTTVSEETGAVRCKAT